MHNSNSPSPYQREALDNEAKKEITQSERDNDDQKHTPHSTLRQRVDPTFSHSETVPTTNYENESRSETTAKKRNGFLRIVNNLTSKKNRIEVYSRTWAAWFPCVVRPHSQTSGTVVVVYHNGTDTVVKLLDPESPLIRTVKGPLYSIYCHSIEKMYSTLCARIKAALQFKDVKTGGMFFKKGVHACFSGLDLVRWLRSLYLGANVLEEDGVMAQLGSELLKRGIIWRVKPRISNMENSNSQDGPPASPQKESDSDVTDFSSRSDYMYAFNDGSVIAELVEKENERVKQQEDRLFWAVRSNLEVFSSSTDAWELATVVATLDPWLLLVYGQEAQAARAKWIHRLDIQTVRHPRRFWRTGSQIWVFSRGDDQWYAGVISSRETLGLGEHQTPKDESTVHVTYGPTDGQGAFTRTKPLKVDSEHIRPRVARLSRMCIRVRTGNSEPIQRVDEIKRKLAAYSKCKEGERRYHDAQPDSSTLIMVCPKVEMNVREREMESRLLSEAQNCEVIVDVVPWELFTAGRDVLYNLPKSSKSE